MSMQEPTDDQLDGLFRKSAEEFNPPFDPAAWQVLKSRLDTHDRLTIWEHLLRWGLPVLLLLVLTGGSWNAHRQQTIMHQTSGLGVAVQQPASANADPATNRPAQSERQQRSNEVQSLPGETVVKPASAIPNGAVETAIVRLNDGKQPVLTDESVGTGRNRDAGLTAISPSAIDKRSRSGTNKLTDRAIRPDKSTMSGKPVNRTDPARLLVATVPASTMARTKQLRLTQASQKGSRRLSGGRIEKRVATTFPATNYAIAPAHSLVKRHTTPDATERNSAKKSPSDISSELVNEVVSVHRFSVGTPAAEPIASYSFIELTSRPGHWPNPLSFTGREVTAPINPAETEKQPPLVQPVVSQKGLSVRFVVSPDLSAIGLRNFQRPGTNIGLLLEYRLASRWSVQAGVIQSTKVYKALPSQYELDSYWASQKLIPESVNGRCNMFDIPINLRYDIALRPRLNGQAPSRWFVSGGITTYIMKKEDYFYNYSEADKPHVYASTPKAWSTSTGRYDFSQLNLSVGYERSISRRLSWQVEPFVKAPLRRVGYYKINLLSTGAFFSLRYKL